MERSEPSLVPEWLRSAGGGGLSHPFASSLADGPLLTLPKRNRTSMSSCNSDVYRSFGDRYSSANSRRSPNRNGSSLKHDKNPYSRSNSSSTRNQRDKDREMPDVNDTWDSEYSDPLTSLIDRRVEKDTLKRSQSMISRKQSDFSQRRAFSELRNRSHNIDGNGNGAVSVCNGSSGTQKVSFERDFPLLGSDERPTAPDLRRVPVPGLSRSVKGLSIGTSPLLGCEGWTSALAEVPVGIVGNNTGTSPGALPCSDTAEGPFVGDSASTTSATDALDGLNTAETFNQAPARSDINPQQSLETQRFEERPFVGTKKLIPMTPLMPKTTVPNSSDKLKPKTAARSNDGVAGPKNGLHQMSSLQLGGQAVRGGSARADGSKSFSGMLLLKPGQNGLPSTLKGVPSQTVKGTSAVTNSVASLTSTLKNSNNMKLYNNERRISAYRLNAVPVVDKRFLVSQLRSRNDFFNLVRKKSMGTASVCADSCSATSSGVENFDEVKELGCAPVSATDNVVRATCNGDTYDLDESFSGQRESHLSYDEVIHSDEEELDFLRTLGWKDDAGDEEGLTEEEISAFVEKYMKWRPNSKVLRCLQSNITAESDPHGPCSTGASAELSIADASL